MNLNAEYPILMRVYVVLGNIKYVGPFFQKNAQNGGIDSTPVVSNF